MPRSGVTFPVRLTAPHDRGSYRLQVVAVQEFVRWLDQPGSGLVAVVEVEVT
jgi:hypothetical protein